MSKWHILEYLAYADSAALTHGALTTFARGPLLADVHVRALGLGLGLGLGLALVLGLELGLGLGMGLGLGLPTLTITLTLTPAQVRALCHGNTSSDEVTSCL